MSLIRLDFPFHTCLIFSHLTLISCSDGSLCVSIGTHITKSAIRTKLPEAIIWSTAEKCWQHGRYSRLSGKWLVYFLFFIFFPFNKPSFKWCLTVLWQKWKCLFKHWRDDRRENDSYMKQKCMLIELMQNIFYRVNEVNPLNKYLCVSETAGKCLQICYCHRHHNSVS